MEMNDDLIGRVARAIHSERTDNYGWSFAEGPLSDRVECLKQARAAIRELGMDRAVDAGDLDICDEHMWEGALYKPTSAESGRYRVLLIPEEEE